jgi:ribonuclease BN (tRNA processing enzyme)
MDHPSFPVHLSDMGATMTFHDLYEGQPLTLDSGDARKPITISIAPGNHPNGVWAFRIEHGGRVAVYATDTEHYAVVDAHLAVLAKGADILIYDSQYTPEEYAGTAGTGGPKTGWGHSTFEEAAKLARAAGVKRLVLFHHDPMQSDAAVREKERRARALFAETVAAYEGLSIEL